MNTVVRKLALKRHYNGEPELCMVEIDIDIEGIAQSLGTKAFRNKSKKTIALGGDIQVRAYPCKQESK